MTPSQYLIEYRDAAGNLLLPQYGGCWPVKPECARIGGCLKINCGPQSLCLCDSYEVEYPNIATPQGFFDLWPAMQAREDWPKFLCRVGNPSTFPEFDSIYTKHINPATFPETVASYLKGLER